MFRSACPALLALLVPMFSNQSPGQGGPDHPASRWQFRDVPLVEGTSYAGGVPTLREVVGHRLGERLTDHCQTVAYCLALAAGSDRVTYTRYGETWQGRSLGYLAITSPSNHARLDRIRATMQDLADPRRLGDDPEAAARELLDDQVAVLWLGYSVHGDEISCTDAALGLAYHLAAARGDPLVDRILEHTVVVVDPVQNPDGRDRFVHHARTHRGRWPSGEPLAAERDQTWPGGRVNHYLFDLNRDWFARTQPETRARIAAWLEWRPVVFADVHEMGTDSSYYFPPPAEPYNPEITRRQRAALELMGRGNARRFDENGYDYFTRDVFDAFYPGYGDSWPAFQGAVGMTYEQGSARGLWARRSDGTWFDYRDSVQRQFVASLATCETVADNRRKLLEDFFLDRLEAIREGRQGRVRELVWTPGEDPERAARLARQLLEQGVEVHRADGPLECPIARGYRDRETRRRTFPVGSFVVRMEQPAKRLATVLLDDEQLMDPAFVQEQLERHAERKSTSIYDVTAWSLPLLWDLDAYACERPTTGQLAPVVASTDVVAAVPEPPAEARPVVWLLPAAPIGTMRVLAALLTERVEVDAVGGEGFEIDGRSFRPGALLVKTRSQPDGLDPEQVHGLVRRLAAEHGVEAVPLDSTWVRDGTHFGSNDVRRVQPPRVAIAWDRPVEANSAGEARYSIEQELGWPVTAVRTERLVSPDLDRFDVLVLPDGSSGGYAEVLGKSGAERLAAWVERGGTLIACGSGPTRWLASSKDHGLLAIESEPRRNPKAPAKDDGGRDGKSDGSSGRGDASPWTEEDYERARQPLEERPARTPGAILRAVVDPEHWTAFGAREEIFVQSSSSDVYTPVRLDKGTNVGVFAGRDTVLRSGFAWPEKLDQIARKPWLVHQPRGRGHVVAYAEDPNSRAFCLATFRSFANAVLLGKSF